MALGGPNQRMALAMLITDPAQAVSIDRLIEGIWDDSPPEQSRHTLQAYVSELRKIVGDPITWTGSGYLLGTEPERIDSHRFDQLASNARNLVPRSPERAAQLLRQALELWRGEPYADLAHVEALQPEIRRLNQLRVAAIEDRVEADLAMGLHRAVVEELEVLTREHPFRERLHGQLMLALYRSRRQAEALRAYQRARVALAEELGIEPSSELRDLEQRILEQDPALDLSAVAGLHLGSSGEEEESAGVSGRDEPYSIRGFEFRELVGEGHLGRVFRAYQPSMGREVALKVIRSQFANDAGFVRRFEADAQVVAGLEHPHIMSLYDYWRDAEGTYLVMPWLASGSLATELERGPLTLAATMKLVDQVGSALSYAHRHGVLHRNITPSNVVLDGDGNAYLSDFRLVAVEGPPRVSGYVAPEEMLDIPVTAQTDLFRFAVTIHTALAGLDPDDGAALAALAEMRDDVPVDVDVIIARATARDPADRYSRVEDFVRELRRATGSDVVPVPSGPAEVPGLLRNPYKGLRAFQETDADDFFGREDLIGTLLDAVDERKLVAVVGSSGSGKSSLVRAGLIPSLRSGVVAGSETWLITDMFPGSHPFEELSYALERVAVKPVEDLLDELASGPAGFLRVVKRILPNDDAQLLLIVDQFEELFSMVVDPEIRRLFLDAMALAATDPDSRLRTVITLRADFFDRPLQFHRFGELMRSGLVSIPTLSPDGLARAVSGPARNIGLELEPGLAAEIVRDVEGQPGSLPLFQHTLGELFDHREGRQLTIDAYRRTGGVSGALSRRAEQLYQSLTRVEQEATENIFLRLVTVDETREDTRRRVRRSELASFDVGSTTIDSILQRFGAHRLLSFDHDQVTRGATVEVAHEALINEWERFRGWIDTSRSDLLLHHRLEWAVREWLDSGRQQAFLLTGGRLEYFEQWAADTDLILTSREHEFLTLSRTREDARRTRRRRKRRMMITGLTVIAVVTSILAVVATSQQRRAERGERTALVRELTSAAHVNLDQDPDLALLLAIEGIELAVDAPREVAWDATAALHQALLATPKVVAVDGGGRVAWSPTGDRIVTLGAGSEDQDAHIWDATTGEPLGSLTGVGDPTDLAWSQEGDLIVVAHAGSPAAVWDANSYQLIRTIGDHSSGYVFSHLTSDGATLVLSELPPTGGRPTAVTVWDVETATEQISFDFPAGTWSTALSPDGMLLAVPEPETHLVRVFDVRSQKELFQLEQGRQVDFAAYSPDGRLLATVGANRIMVWDGKSDELVEEYTFPGAGATVLEWSPDGTLIGVGGMDTVTYLLDIGEEGEPVALSGHRSPVNDVAFSPDGLRIASSGADTRIWDMAALSGGEVMTYQGPGTQGPGGTHAVWTTDATRVLTTSFDNGATTVFEAESGRLLDSFPNQAAFGITARAIPSPDGRYIAITGATRDDPSGPIGTTRILDANTLAEVTVLDPGGNPAAFSADSSLLLIGNFGAAHVYEVGSWRHLTALVDLTSRTEGNYAVWAGHFLSDGRHLVTGDSGRRQGAALWDMTDWSIVGTIPVEGGSSQFIAASADGRLVALGTVSAGLVSVFEENDILAGPPETAEPVAQFDAPDGLTFIALNPDGSVLITGGLTRQLTFWDVTTQQRMFTLETGSVPGEPTFSDDGRHLLVPFENEVTHLLSLDPQELIDLARSRVARDFTGPECGLYLHVESCPARDN